MAVNQKPIVLDVQSETPQDLMSIKELCLKHGFDYNYLYKWSIRKGVIKVYNRGTWKLSENEVLEFTRNRTEEKLSKIKDRKRGVR